MADNKIDTATENMIKNLEEKTGKKFSEWVKIVTTSGITKHGEIVTMLKTKHALTHGYANLVAHKARGSDAGSSGEEGLITSQFRGKENLMPWYEKILKEIKSFGNDVEISPKKAYVSIRRKKQFAIIQPTTKTRLDVGLNMKGIEPKGALEASGSFNSMCTHRVRVEDEKSLNKELVSWLKKAYEQAG